MLKNFINFEETLNSNLNENFEKFEFDHPIIFFSQVARLENQNASHTEQEMY